MDLYDYHEKHVRIVTRFGDTLTGVADYFPSEYCLHEYGEDEDCVIIGDVLIYRSSIASIEEIEVHGTAELRTERFKLRRYCLEDAADLYRQFGTDPSTYEYTGWNPYATEEMALETVRRFIAGYEDEHFYGWVLDADDVLFGTIGAYDYSGDQIEVGYSIIRPVRGRGYATEALKAVLTYLTENEGIPCVIAWCASSNIGSVRTLEKAGMKLVRTEKNGLAVGDRVFDKLTYEYRRPL